MWPAACAPCTQVSVDSLHSIHKYVDDSIDWNEVRSLPEPPDPSCNAEMWAYYHEVAPAILDGDIDTYLRSLRVTGKGSKERIIYLNDACRQALGEYLVIRQSTQVKPGETALFVSSRGTRISVKTVQHMVGKYLDAAGLGNKGFSTHKLRHTAATLMYQSGEVDIRTLKDILGHEQLNTTQIYTHVSDAGMESAMSKNPLANVKIKRKLPVEAEDTDTEDT